MPAQPSKPNTIPLIEAKERVAHALYADDWIDHLKQREEWVLKHYRRYLPLDLRPQPMLPGDRIYVSVGGGISTELTPSLREELAHAVDRQEWMIEQYEKVEQWFDDRGFDSEANKIDRDRFESAFAKSFPNAAPKVNSAKVWITVDIKNMKAEGELPEGIRITTLAKALEKRMAAAVKAGHISHTVTWQHIKNELPSWGLWPLSKIK